MITGSARQISPMLVAGRHTSCPIAGSGCTSSCSHIGARGYGKPVQPANLQRRQLAVLSNDQCITSRSPLAVRSMRIFLTWHVGKRASFISADT